MNVAHSSITFTRVDNISLLSCETMCNPPSPSCHLDECSNCPGTDILKEELAALLDETSFDEIIFKQWVSTGRSTLETFCLSTEEFVDRFCEKIDILRPHSFVAKQQAAFFSSYKTGLKAGDIRVMADFSERYSFVLQDASHWNNNQATIHPLLLIISRLVRFVN